jgi:hypothetical protein
VNHGRSAQDGRWASFAEKPTGRALSTRLIVVEDRPDATTLGEQRVGAIPGQLEVEVLVGFLLAVPLDNDRDRLRRLAGREGQRPGPGDIVAVARRGGAARGA